MEYYSSGITFTALKQVVQELPVTFIGVEGLVTGLIAVNSLHEVVHGFLRSCNLCNPGLEIFTSCNTTKRQLMNHARRAFCLE